MRVAAFALLGLVVGSFLTVVVHRVPREESVVAPRSRCPSCGAEIRAIDNIPLVSYLLLRGRCRHCGRRISPAYPLIELGTAGLFAATALSFEDTWTAGILAPFLALMLALGIIDARHRIVPNRVTYPAVALFTLSIVVASLLGGGVAPVDGLLGLLLYAAPLFLIALAVPRGMGMGDVKLAALIGLVLGAVGLRYVAVAAALGIVGGGVGALAAMAVLRLGRKEHIPFGPFLAAGAVVAAFAAPQIASAYLSLLP